MQVETAADTDSGKNVGSIEISDWMTYGANKAPTTATIPSADTDAQRHPRHNVGPRRMTSETALVGDVSLLARLRHHR